MKLFSFSAVIAGYFLLHQVSLSPMQRSIEVGISDTNSNSNENDVELAVNVGSQKNVQAQSTLARASTSTAAPICPNITNFDHGNVSCPNGHDVGDSCSFSCDQGYSLNGSSTVTCLSTRSWDPIPLPTCDRTSCGVPASNFSNGHVTCSGYTYGDVCSFSCAENYTISGGSNTSQCSSNGSWGQIPSCEFTCGDPTVIGVAYATLNCTQGFNIGATCDVSCFGGYNGADPTISCSASGWSFTACSPLPT